MIKRIVCVLLTLTMLMASFVSVGAFYKSGELNHLMTYAECTYTENASVSSRGEISVENVGSVTYDCLITFPIGTIDFSYETETDTRFTVTFDGVLYEYEGVLPAENKNFSYKLSSVVSEGEHIIKFTFEDKIKIKSISMVQYNWDKPDSHIIRANDAKAKINFSISEELVHSAVIIAEGSSAIMVNGATRYINNDNISLKPRYFEGNLCLPIHTLARALGYYYEDKPELDFTLMRYSQTEFIRKNGVMTKDTSAGVVDANLPIYRDADGTWAGIRYFAEATGDAVVYDEGIVYIDYKHQVQKIRESAVAKSYIAETLGIFEEQVVAGRTYYVAQTENASDKNPGTKDAPFRTLNKAGKVAEAGDTVIIREGTYREEFVPQNDGTALNPIVFRAAEGEEVVISAADVLDNFLPYGNDGWVCASLPKDLGFGHNQMFYKGEGLIEARYPNGQRMDMGEGNEPLSDYWPTRGDFLIESDDDPYKVISPGGLLEQDEKDYWKGAIYVSAHGRAYTLCPSFVTSSEKGSLRIGKVPTRFWWSPDSYNGFFDFGYLQGIKPCMDIPGEWIVEDDTLFMIPPEGETAQSLVIEAKTRQRVANLDDRKYVHLKGIKTIGGSITMDNTEMCMLDNVDMNYIAHFTFAEDMRDGYLYEDARKVNGEASPQFGEVGVWVEGKNNIIKDSRFNHSAGCGLWLSGLYAYVEGNLVTDCGYASGYPAGIYVYPNLTKPDDEPRGGFAIYENDVSRAGRSVFMVHAPENRDVGWERIAYVPYEVAYNAFHEGMLTTVDVGITYIYGCKTNTDRVYSKMHHNYVYMDVGEKMIDQCTIYHDGGSAGVNTFGNVCFSANEMNSFFMETITEHELGNANWIGMNADIRNSIIGGPEGLQTEDFPCADPFYAGLRSGRESFMKNYSYNGNFLKLEAKDAILSGGATFDSKGRIRFNTETARATFENVNFGDRGLDMADVYFAASRYARWSRMCIKIGDTYETAVPSMFLTRSEHYSNSELVNAFIKLNDPKGVTNVYIEMYAHKDETFALDSIIFTDNALDYGTRDGSYMYASRYDSVERVGLSDMFIRGSIENGHHKDGFLTYLWDSKWRYNNVKIPENSNYIAVYAGTGESYDSMELKFTYVKDGVEKTLGSTRTQNLGWGEENVPVYVKIPDDVAVDISGQVVDICIEAGTTLEGGLATANLYHFDFVDERIEPQATDGSLVYGGNFSDIIEISDENNLPRRKTTNGRDATPFVNNVWSGSTLLYENIEVDKEAKRLYCTTGAEGEYAGQKITFRYAKKNETQTRVLGTFVTTANGLETDTEKEYINLPADFEAGEIDIYVDFGNTETGKKATCNFFKFGFTK